MYLWPQQTFPNPTVDFSGGIKTSVIRTKMDTGRIRQRRRFTSDVRTCKVSWELKDDEFAMFQAVHKYKLSDGADWFTIELPQGDSLQPYRARFSSDGYTYDHRPILNWKVSATLEIEDASLPMSEEVLDTLLQLGDLSSLENVAEELHEFIHNTYPTQNPA